MSDQHQETIFVYGTLRRHGSNAFRMDGATFLGHASALGLLYRVEWYPGAIFDSCAETSIVGELYQITKEHLQALDDFEGDEYQRVNILTITPNGPVKASAWQYRRPVERLTRMQTGDWLKEYHP
jgi:gamma-glutamylcyclotransferase (GGCT)/AIG2-like uncharacterized protein YtfP